MTKHPLITLYLVMVAWSAAWTALRSPGGTLELVLTPILGAILPWLVTVLVWRTSGRNLTYALVAACGLGMLAVLPALG